MKNIYRISTEQHEGIKSGITQSKNSTISQAVCAGRCKSQAIHTSLQK